MPTDFHATLIEDISTPLNAWLAEGGAEDGAALAPPTREGSDLAMPCHRYARVFRKNPNVIAQELAAVAETHPLVAGAEAVNGFLNLHLNWSVIAERLVQWATSDDGAVGRGVERQGDVIVIEYSAPNTNKPLHVGHARNNIIGQTVGNLLEARGAEVIRTNLINDRGIHICKSMVAYRRSGAKETPESQGIKGDHFVGSFYVAFDRAFQAEYASRYPAGDGPGTDKYFNEESELGTEAREMLRLWEAGDADVRSLWETMNGWCEAGFDETYRRMGVTFAHVDHESETYLLGRSIVEEGLEAGEFYRLDDGAIAFDLERIDLDGKKIVLRSDGTSLYVTQDIGTATLRHGRTGFDQCIYVVGNEQDHYFKVLFGILGTVRPELAGRLVHRSYGMVELPDGKMKSREGTVVDADDLMDELQNMVTGSSNDRWDALSEGERTRRAEVIGMAGLKFFLLKVNPRTSFVFDKENSISIEGETGPYCQYATARCANILKKLGDDVAGVAPDWSVAAHPRAQDVMTTLMAFPGAVARAADQLDPSQVAKATYGVARAFSRFYNEPACRILGAPPARARALSDLVRATHRVLIAGLALIGIEALEEM